jgi:hypothetical protein
MSFIPNAEEVARAAMGGVDPTLEDTYASLIKFLAAFPEAASAMRGSSAPAIGSRAYIERQATSFAVARVPRAPQAPATVPDEMVSVILHEYFDIPIADLDRAKKEHLLSMGAENLVGDLVERYLASVMESRGWIWCAGSMVKAVDFVKPPVQSNGKWRLLQVKNRDNSENSSSSAIRKGTEIEKWHRTFSKRIGSNWAAFPEPELRPHLSEAEFKTYVREYLHALRK